MSGWWALGAVIVFLAVLAAGYGYAEHLQHRTEQAWKDDGK